MGIATDEARERPSPRQAPGFSAEPEVPAASLLALEAHVLVGRERYQVLRVEHVLGHPRPDSSQRTVVHDRREHDPVDRELLDAMEQRLALGVITLPPCWWNRSSRSG